MKWNGQYWERDDHNQHLAAVEGLVDSLLEEAAELSKKIDWAIKKKNSQGRSEHEALRTAVYKRVTRLRTDRGRSPCIKFAVSCRKPLTITAEDIDLNPWLLACRNGVIDLRSGKFRDGRPEEYITKVSPIEWKGFDEKCPQWEHFLFDIFNDNQELVDYIQRLLGYATSGSIHEHIMPVFWGKGRNGKGTLVKVLQYIMGPLAGTIQTELLLHQKMQRSSAGPSPDIVDLKGLRMAFASETEEGQRFSASKVKWLTGGDRLVGRNLNEKSLIRFDPTHHIFLLTNNKPTVAGDDYAFWQRMHLIPFRISYVLKPREEMENFERPADLDLEKKLKAEASGILAWLVQGCLDYQKNGVQPPQAVKEATLDYQWEEDLLGQFVNIYCLKTLGAKTKSSDIYDKFNRWFKSNNPKSSLSHKVFGTMMRRRFDATKINGVVYYNDIELNITKIVELPTE
jgi:putative DNA primase/helicase